MNRAIDTILSPVATLFVATLLLASCNEDRTMFDLGDTQGGQPIVVSAAVMETRGTVATESNFVVDGAQFPLYAYDSNVADYFNTTVTYSGGSWNYHVDGEDDCYYWPEEENAQLIFYAYNLPESGEEGTPLHHTAEGEHYISFTSPYDATSQEDVIIAEQINSTSGTDVTLAFEHALSKLNFTLTLDTEEANIRNVKLYYTYKNLYTTGNYYFSHTGGAWSDLSGNEPISDGQSDLAAYDLDTYNKTHTYDENLFVIP